MSGENAEISTIVPSNERIAVAIRHNAVHLLLRLLQRDIHISVQTREDSYRYDKSALACGIGV